MDDNVEYMSFPPSSLSGDNIRPEIEGYLRSGWSELEICSLLDRNELHRFRKKDKGSKKKK